MKTRTRVNIRAKERASPTSASLVVGRSRISSDRIEFSMGNGVNEFRFIDNRLAMRDAVPSPRHGQQLEASAGARRSCICYGQRLAAVHAERACTWQEEPLSYDVPSTEYKLVRESIFIYFYNKKIALIECHVAVAKHNVTGTFDRGLRAPSSCVPGRHPAADAWWSGWRSAAAVPHGWRPGELSVCI